MAYRGDGVVSAQINDDLLELCDKIGLLVVACVVAFALAQCWFPSPQVWGECLVLLSTGPNGSSPLWIAWTRKM